MANSIKTYPYPVLGNNDDIEGSFQFTVNPELDQDEVDIVIEFNLDHSTLEHLIRSGEAAFSVDVSCKKTLYKQNFQSNDSKYSIKIDADSLRDRVDVTGFVIATTDIK